MQAMERFGVPRHIVGFVMPTGYSFNLDGSTLYLAMASGSWRRLPRQRWAGTWDSVSQITRC